MLKKRVPYLILMLVLLVSFVAASDHYIAGGYIGTDNMNFIQVLNPTSKQANIDITFFFEKNSSTTHEAKVGAFSTLSIDVSNIVSGSFAAVVSSESDIIVDDVQFDNTYSAGFGSESISDSAFVWYFPEGYSSGMAKTYLYLFNPGTRTSTIGVTLYYDSGEKKTFTEEVPAKKSLRIDLKERSMPEKRFSIKVTGTAPIVASSGYLNKRFSAGSGGHGTTDLSDTWYFPDGFVSTDATEFLNLLNPSFEAAHIDVTLYYTDGSVRQFSETVPANSKKMVLMNNYAESIKWYSTVVESDIDIAASTTHFDDTYSAGHGGIGATKPVTFTYFAYAVAGDSASSHLAVFNPSDDDAELEITLFYADGTIKTITTNASSLARSNIDLNKQASNLPFGISIETSVPVVTQLVIFGKAFSAGHSYVGLPAKKPSVITKKSDAQNTVIETDSVSPIEPEYKLVKTETLAPSKFKGSVREGLDNVLKSTYDYAGKTILVWRFAYVNTNSAGDASDAVLEGGLFTMLEVSPAIVSGAAVHDFISRKSEGIVWQNGSDIYLFVAAKGSPDLATGLASSIVSPSNTDEKAGLISILLIITALIALIIIIRWLFRSSEEDDWEEMIPSAAPEKLKVTDRKKKAAEKKKSPVKKKLFRKNKVKKVEVKKETKKPETKEEPKQTEKEKPKAAKKEPVAKKEPADIPKKSQEKKPKLKTIARPNISIKEKVNPTAQDILDELEHIPDYEDVFRHVNRDNEEIKPK